MAHREATLAASTKYKIQNTKYKTQNTKYKTQKGEKKKYDNLFGKIWPHWLLRQNRKYKEEKIRNGMYEVLGQIGQTTKKRD